MARQYKRDANGKFASSSNATTTTTGKAGGFASQQHRSNVQMKRQAEAAQRTTGNTTNSGSRNKALVRAGVRAAYRNPAVRRLAVSASVVGVATAINAGVGGKRGVQRLGTKRGRNDLQKAYNKRQLNQLLAKEKRSPLLNGARAVLARPQGGGSKGSRPTMRYARSTIRSPSARLRLTTAKRALSGRI